MELSARVPTSRHLCQLITDLRRCRTYLYFLTFVCLLVVCLFSAFDTKSTSLFDYSRYSKREIYFISKTENRHLTTNTQKYVLSCCATKKTERSMCIGFIVAAWQRMDFSKKQFLSIFDTITDFSKNSQGTSLKARGD